MQLELGEQVSCTRALLLLSDVVSGVLDITTSIAKPNGARSDMVETMSLLPQL
ncbi:MULTISPECIES: hypothetical protein [unclassified Caballeronia]|uniref:hypothetical protein n=1 Tax=unclassified Caballeronia TaxID=2646786 RepID=UPI0028671463|nr:MULTISPECIES: hypothetical protein [unclassified Caballeronia]MDR5770932.1 hypothetical protein [Caballeronia sp. LZ002]MDR5846369.1 hypothetical protein [Caballeronia sp. LZ003]